MGRNCIEPLYFKMTSVNGSDHGVDDAMKLVVNADS